MSKHVILGEPETSHSGKYMVAAHAPPPTTYKQSHKQTEAPQLKYIPYRGVMTPGKSRTNERVKVPTDASGDFKAKRK